MSKLSRAAVAAAVLATVVAVPVVVRATASEAVTTRVLPARVLITTTSPGDERCVNALPDGNGVEVVLCPSQRYPSSMWFLPVPETNVIQLRGGSRNRCLGVTSTKPLEKLRLYSCGSTTGLYWFVEQTREMTFQYRNVLTDRCMDLSSDKTYLVQRTCDTSDDWFITPIGASTQFKAMHSGKCLDIAGDTSGAVAQQWTCLGNAQPNQLFTLELVRLPGWYLSGSGQYSRWHVRPGMYRIHAQHSLLCLHHAQEYLDGSRVRQRPCDDFGGMWYLYPVDLQGGRQIFVVRQEHYHAYRDTCLDVRGRGQQDGAIVEIWQCLGTGQTNQLWQLTQMITM